MRVVVHPADLGGCGHYRLIWVAEALARQGHDVVVAHDETYQARWQPSVFGDRIIGLAQPVDADVVVMQRPLHRNRVELIEALQAEGVAVVVEIDDDFHAIHPRNPAWKGANPLSDPDVNRDWLMRACDRADLVTVSTPALAARYGTHGRVRILDNYVPTRYTLTQPGKYAAEHLGALAHDGVMVGWSGSVDTHPGDLDVTQGAVAQAVRDTGARFGVIGTGKGVQRTLGLDDPPATSGWLPIIAYAEGLAMLDVGIVPLAAHTFNEAKSHLKGLEFAAVGVPFVASGTGPYRALAQAGIGWIAESPAEWRYLVSELIRDTAHREALAQAWRAEVSMRWTVEQNAWRWAEAWAHAAARKVAA